MFLCNQRKLNFTILTSYPVHSVSFVLLSIVVIWSVLSLLTVNMTMQLIEKDQCYIVNLFVTNRCYIIAANLSVAFCLSTERLWMQLYLAIHHLELLIAIVFTEEFQKLAVQRPDCKHWFRRIHATLQSVHLHHLFHY